MLARTRCSRFAVSLLALASVLAIPAASAEARGCRIRSTASGSFTGSVTKAESTFTRFAITVQYRISSLSFQKPRSGPWLADCPERAEPVSIRPDRPSNDPLMNLFLMDVRQGAPLDAQEQRPAVGAALEELSDAARNLQLSTIGTGYAEIAVDVAAAWRSGRERET